MRKATVTVSLTLLTALSACSACSKGMPPADLAKARSVMNALLEAERDHRGSHGGYWRDQQPTLDRDATKKGLGVSLRDAEDFDFTIDPPESGYDPKLRVTARGRGEDSDVSLTCVLDAAKNEPECAESAGAPS